MYIRKIEIEHFGKLNNYTLDFSEGLNFIYGRNEDGKSTIMAFIRMMFYGNQANTRDVSTNTRKRYKPWNGAAMGGAIEFESKGVNYRLQKHFGPTAGKDEVELINMDTGFAEELNHQEEVGSHFFGMQLDGFERSVFIGRSGGFGSSDNDGITERLINLTTSADEKLSLKTATDELNTAIEKLVSKRGNAGLLVNARERVLELERELRSANANENAQRSLREELETLTSLQNAEKKRLEGVVQKRKNADEAAWNLNERKESLNTLERRAELFEKEKENRLQMAALKQKQAEERIAQAEDAANNKKNLGGKPIFVILAVLALLIALPLGFLVSKWCFAAAALTPLLLLVEFSGKSRNKRMESYRKAAADRVELLENELEELLENSGKEAYEDEKRLAELKQQIELTKKNVAQAEGTLKELKKQLVSDNELENSIIERETKISRLRSEIKSPNKPISLILEEKEEAEEKLEEYEQTYSALKLALRVMEESAEELRKNFGPKLNERTAEIFSGLTGGRYCNVTVNKDFGIKVLADGDMFYHEGGYLSNGTVDQAYFALRLAIVELLTADSEQLPLMLDDIFEQYDDSRTEDGIAFLNVYAREQEGQVILFTCHKHVLEKARQIAPLATHLNLS